jgi:hypothetical protein
MLRHKIILGSIVCLFTAGWLTQALCQTQSSGRRVSPSEFVRTKQLEAEQRRKEFEKRVAAENKERQDRWIAEQRQKAEQRARDNANGKNEHRNKLIKQTLEMTEAQWKVIEPKINKVCFFKDQSGINIAIGGTSGYRAGGWSGSGGSSAGGTSSSGTGAGTTWQTQSSSSGGGMATGGGGGAGGGGGGITTVSLNGPQWRYAGRELTEGEKTCEELQALLEDKNSKQQDIDQKIETLRRARENAAKDLAKARQELREVLTSRQQARLVLTGLLD